MTEETGYKKRTANSLFGPKSMYGVQPENVVKNGCEAGSTRQLAFSTRNPLPDTWSISSLQKVELEWVQELTGVTCSNEAGSCKA